MTWAGITSSGPGIVESGGGFVAIGARHEARRVLRYLRVTQEADGHWTQNMWLDGSPYWHGIQMDETALPILLVDLAARRRPRRRRAGHVLADGAEGGRFLVGNGPVSPQDRWEEDPGYSPFTIAVRDRGATRRRRLADCDGETRPRPIPRETADTWNAGIDDGSMSAEASSAMAARRRRLLRARRGAGSRGRGVTAETVSSRSRTVLRIGSSVRASSMVSPDALAFVRFGLRAPDDPRIANTVKVIDATLRVETPRGPAWHRYQGDGYGEHADGRPFDGTGIGRAWPLLTGERAHFELAAGRREVAEQLAQTLEAFAGESGLLPEQVWDTD